MDGGTIAAVVALQLGHEAVGRTPVVYTCVAALLQGWESSAAQSQS